MLVFLIVVGTGLLAVAAYLAWDLKKKLDPNRLSVVMVDTHGYEKTYSVTKIFDKDNGGEKFTIGETTYNVDPDCIIYSGLFHIAKSYYNEGKITPVNIRKLEKKVDISATDYYEATEGNAIRNIIDWLKPSWLTPEFQVGIVLLGVVGVGGIVWYLISQDIQSLKAAIDALANSNVAGVE